MDIDDCYVTKLLSFDSVLNTVKLLREIS